MDQKPYIRAGDKYLYTDIIKIDHEYIRIGTFPQISKHLNELKIKTKYIILLPPVITLAGDNYTGEEFVIWNMIYKKETSSPNIYIGDKKYVRYLYHRLKYTVNQTFNIAKTRIVKRNSIKKFFKGTYIKPDTHYKLNDRVRIYYGISNIQIFYKDRLLYDWQENNPSLNIHKKIAQLLIPYKKSFFGPFNSLSIIPLGSGNGFHGHTSNFIIQYASRNIWVDVMAKPFLALRKINFPWDNITDYFISHVHEDHIEGFSSILEYASIRNKPVNLITTFRIFKQLEKIYTFLFPDFNDLVNHINIIPHSTLPYYHGYLTVRLSHHVLRSGTLGLKIRYKNNVFALSGDTFYSEEFEKKHPQCTSVDSSWYNDCDLIFHEVEFFKKDTVHTYYTEIKKLQNKLNGKILVYHNSSDKFLLPGVKEYNQYIIKNGEIEIK
ncbi:MAG: hypothetical protein KKH98_00440 [Spirochaetes bacterium]|nr:hypothetical protein [Spirochaetota bacterium]